MTASTSRIQPLPEDLVARIAAGEVIERPASILKELLENSLDAGSTRISVAIEGAGRTRIAISDNGCGMTPEEARLSLKRHATSKISKLEDLEALATFGFRGEALPSIAAVSRFRMVTRNAESDHAWEIEVEGGKIVLERPAAREPGTTIEVRDLFFNTPARFKFLKSDGSERGHCLRVVEEAVFSSLGTTFELANEKGKPLVFRSAPASRPDERAESLRIRVGEVWGGRWTEWMLPVVSASPHFAVTGVVTRQSAHQATPRHQFLYINRRPVQNRRLTRAVYDAFMGQLPTMRHPGWTLFLDVDPSTVDVNVHPSKREVKLTHESELFGFLSSAVRSALSRTAPAPEFPAAAPLSSLAAPQLGSTDSSFYAQRSTPATFTSGTKAGEPRGPAFTPAAGMAALGSLYEPLFSPEVASGREVELADIQDTDLQPLAQIRQTFIVAEGRNGLLLFDQHAAAEKAAYEKIMADLTAGTPRVQMLLVPFTWEAALSTVASIQENLELFNSMGFVIEPFGGTTFVVKGLPAHLGDKVDVSSLLDGLSDAIGEPLDRKGGIERNREHRIAAMAACKASVKAGDRLDLRQCHHILKELARCQSPFTCPHGRPTVLKFTFDELERRFRRK